MEPPLLTKTPLASAFNYSAPKPLMDSTNSAGLPLHHFYKDPYQPGRLGCTGFLEARRCGPSGTTEDPPQPPGVRGTVRKREAPQEAVLKHPASLSFT